MNPTILEDVLCSKPYFEAAHCFVAFEDNEMSGMALVGFAPNESCDDLDLGKPVISRLMVDPGKDFEPTAEALLEHCLGVAREHQASDIAYGSRFPDSPFFDGAYGGSLVPGVPELELNLKRFLESHGFMQREQIEA